MSPKNSDTVTLHVLLFKLKLVRVRSGKKQPLPDLLDCILQATEYDLPTQVHAVAQKYTSRNVQYFTPRAPYPIDNINVDPAELNLDDANLRHLPSYRGIISNCMSGGKLPADGSFLHLIIEEPSPIGGLRDHERFYSREVVLFLMTRGLEVYPVSTEGNVCCGRIRNTMDVICKLGQQSEAEAFEKLRPFNDGTRHTATLAIDSCPLPTGDYLITMPSYGQYNLAKPLFHERPLFVGPVILKLTRQLCTAVAFLHSHDMYHLDIKPGNIVLDTKRDCELTLVDLGWVMSPLCPGETCWMKQPGGTYGFVAPEVQLWLEWELETKSRSSVTSLKGAPPKYDAREADAWAVGNIVHILLEQVLTDQKLKVEYSEELDDLRDWMKERRPRVDLALRRFNYITEPRSIEDLSGDERFLSREVDLILWLFEVEVYPIGNKTSNVCPGRMRRMTPVLCKLVQEKEALAFENLKHLNPRARHIAPLIFDPHLLPTGDYLITMQSYGMTLTEAMRPSRRSALTGPYILGITYRLCAAIAFLHSHHMFHLDINPANLTVDTNHSCAAGTYKYAAPEVRRWFKRELPTDGSQPDMYSPRKADIWAIGNVVHILLRALREDKALEVLHEEKLLAFGEWMMKERPMIEKALKRLDRIKHRLVSPVDSDVDESP